MKQLFLGTVALTVLATAASAADMAPRYAKAPAMAEPIYNWTGFYIGLNAGAASNNTDFAVEASVPNTTLVRRYDDNVRKTGFIGGGQIGYNYQIGMSVVGIEADAAWLSNKTSVHAPFDPFFSGKGTLGAEFSSNIEWLATVRGRAGVAATPSLLLYVTGGVAFAGINTRYVSSSSRPTPLINGYSTTDTRVGWTAGVGAEYALGGGWSVKGEYLRVNFDSHDGLTIPAIAPSNLQGAVKVGQDLDIIRAGLNYKFGGPVVARY